MFSSPWCMWGLTRTPRERHCPHSFILRQFPEVFKGWANKFSPETLSALLPGVTSNPSAQGSGPSHRSPLGSLLSRPPGRPFLQAATGAVCGVRTGATSLMCGFNNSPCLRLQRQNVFFSVTFRQCGGHVHLNPGRLPHQQPCGGVSSSHPYPGARLAIQDTAQWRAAWSGLVQYTKGVGGSTGKQG